MNMLILPDPGQTLCKMQTQTKESRACPGTFSAWTGNPTKQNALLTAAAKQAGTAWRGCYRSFRQSPKVGRFQEEPSCNRSRTVSLTGTARRESGPSDDQRWDIRPRHGGQREAKSFPEGKIYCFVTSLPSFCLFERCVNHQVNFDV